MIYGQGETERDLTKDEIKNIVISSLDSLKLENKKVLFVIPDSTRTCPLPFMFDVITTHLKGKAKACDYLIALGTHMAMDEKAIDKLVGISKADREKKYGPVNIFNHEWNNKDALQQIGTITESDVERVTKGLFKMNVKVDVNKLVFNYDQVIILGPVFPHEVVGFSGGFKYFFPGICGSEFLNFFHWVSAVITNPRIIGTKDTPVRELINLAASFLTFPVMAMCMVVHGKNDLRGLFFDTPKNAWRNAADLAEKLEIVYCDKPYKKILSCSPEMYDDLWTAAKCMYKMECVVEDGGELIIYAPHVSEVSYAHGKIMDEIGYHVRDYFLKQWDKYKNYPWGVVAHSTHVRGIGTYENGIEKGRIKVTLATSIPKERCEKINMGYMDYREINKADYTNKEDEGILIMPRAGERLYKLKNPPDWQKL